MRGFSISRGYRAAGTRGSPPGSSATSCPSPRSPRRKAQTRIDNAAMRRVLERSGFVKEAHYRLGWPVEGRAASDSIGYALLRGDWESGTTTPVPWDA